MFESPKSGQAKSKGEQRSAPFHNRDAGAELHSGRRERAELCAGDGFPARGGWKDRGHRGEGSIDRGDVHGRRQSGRERHGPRVRCDPSIGHTHGAQAYAAEQGRAHPCRSTFSRRKMRY